MRQTGRSAVGIFPVPALALRQPFERRLKPCLTSFVALGLLQPFDVFALMAGAEVIERFGSLLVLFKRGSKVGRHDQRFFGPRRWTVLFDAFVIELDSLLDVPAK